MTVKPKIFQKARDFLGTAFGTARAYLAKPEESTLFLVLANNTLDTVNRPWNNDHIVADIEVVAAMRRKDGMTEIGICPSTIKITKGDVCGIDRLTASSLKPGQWIECHGDYDGAYNFKQFSPITLKVREDLGRVSEKYRPNLATLYANYPFYSEVPSAAMGNLYRDNMPYKF